MNIFNFKTTTASHEVRTVSVDGEPWFVVADVCECLGLKADKANGSYQNHYRRIDKCDLALHTVKTPSGRSTRSKIVAEPGLYKLIMRSDKPEAAAFQDWVTREVLPSIRKTGSNPTHSGG